jgi:hypothetical protein
VADGVDTAMESVQVARCHRACDGTLGIAKRPEQLADRDNAVLPRRQLGQGMVPTLSPRPPPP